MNTLTNNDTLRQVPEGIRPMTVTNYLNITNDILDNCGVAYVQGEIAEAKTFRHLYFKIRDDSSVCDCILWENILKSLDFVPKVGDKVVVCGKSSIYARSGHFSLVASNMFKAGLGFLMEQIRLLQQKLEKEGVFAKANRAIPKFVNTVGVITSAEGKAVHDIIMTLKSRNDGINILIYDARVQGDGAVKSLISALNAANNDNKCDVLIIGRGGGSFEDLLPFSDEKLVRAVADSKTPIISAVGHEPDVALTDFAADVRASTPSVAANLVSSVTKDDIYNALFNYQNRLNATIQRQLSDTYIKFNLLRSRFQNAGPLNSIKLYQSRLNSLELRLDRGYLNLKTSKENELQNLYARLINANPKHLISQKYLLIERYISRLNNALNLTLKTYEKRYNYLNNKLQRIDLKSKIHELDKKTDAFYIRLNDDINELLNERYDTVFKCFAKIEGSSCEKDLQNATKHLVSLVSKLEALNPLALLQKGYTFTTDDTGKSVNLNKVKIGDVIHTLTNNGSITSKIEAIEIKKNT